MQVISLHTSAENVVLLSNVLEPGMCMVGVARTRVGDAQVEMADR